MAVGVSGNWRITFKFEGEDAVDVDYEDYHAPLIAAFGGETMSIYATLWRLKFPREGDEYLGCDWIEVTAQGVPPHIGSPTPGLGYEHGDRYAGFLPPPVEPDRDGDGPFMRAVAFVTESSIKGTDRSGQEYVKPLLVLTGKEYAGITFQELHGRLCDALRGNRKPIVMEILNPDGTRKIIRGER